MKNIYLVLTHTGTILSNIIKYYTKDEFSHVSISLDKELNEMYSFGRINPYNPFYGGFIHERINKGTFKRFKNTNAAVYSLLVTDDEYNNIKDIINKIKVNRKIYHFNILGLFAVGFNIKRHKDYYFYCAEFVKYVLEKSGVKTNLSDLVRPEEFKNINNLKLIYTGKLSKYKGKKEKILRCLEDNLKFYSKKESTI